jgi:ligand-binding sensor domain-containing protein/signal transduction histidine kinase
MLNVVSLSSVRAASVCGPTLPLIWAAASLVLLATQGWLRAENGEYLVDVWTGDQGLPNSSVTALAQTPDGYLWVGTYDGLARFDGVRFTLFDPSTTPELKRSRIRRLHVDSTGVLWINTYDGSLTSYQHGRFRLEWTGDNSADAVVSLVSSRSNQPIFLLHTGRLIRRRPPAAGSEDWDVLRPPGAGSGELCAVEHGGALWCRGRDQKLWRFADEKFEVVPTKPDLEGQNLHCLVADYKGRIWVGTEKEIAVWNGKQFNCMTPTNGEPSVDVRFLYCASDGSFWVIANDRVRRARARQWVSEARPCRGVFTGALDRLGMQEDRRGGVWIYHYGKGIFHINANGETRQFATQEDFPGERVDCFFEDREGNLWAGVDRGGLVRLREKRFSVLSTGASPAAKAAVTVAQDDQGTIWVGTYGGGLSRLRQPQFAMPADPASLLKAVSVSADDRATLWPGDSGERQQRGYDLSEPVALPEGMRNAFVFSVCPDREGHLWVSAGEEDLFREADGRWEPVTPAVHGVKALLGARDGRVWIGTKTGLIFCTQDGTPQFQSVEGVSRTDVRALAEDPQGTVWVGMGNGRLYSLCSNQVAAYQSEDQLAAQPIWSLCADAAGSVWAGTFRGGLLHFRDGAFVRYTCKDGLPDDVICQILDDGDGRLWIGSHQGIFSVAKSDLEACASSRGGNAAARKIVDCTSYGRYDGLPSLECSGSYQPAAWRSKDGRLFFTTLKGVVSVQPGHAPVNRMPPPVVIEDVLVDGQSQATPAEVSVGRRQGLEIPAGKRQIEFRYTGLSFVSPDRVRFRYKLDNLEREWIEAGSRRSAQYSFLRPGSYNFHVTACNNDGVWNPDGAVLGIQVLPHFYETAWCVSLMILAAAGAIAATVRQLVVRRMRSQLETLERQRAVERDRARIAKDIHDDLGAGLTHISLLSELARRAPGAEVPGHLGQISEMARELMKGMDEIVWAVDPHNDSLDGLMTYVCKFAQEYLKVAGIRCRLDLPAELPPSPLSAEARHNLFLAIKETLNNVVKHARASEVRLRLALAVDALTVSIEDNGSGFTSETKTPTGNSTSRILSGYGLENLQRRLAGIGGQARISSQAGRGTRVDLTVGLARARSPEMATGERTPFRGE